jgi:alkyl sulfatase BDS1-like metallo-beta-lactamase superfamily hydrolase
LGYGAENGTWRNFFLQGAFELRTDEKPDPVDLAAPDVVAALTVGQLFDTVAIRVDGPKAWGLSAAVDWVVTDVDVRRRTELSNGVLIQRDSPAGEADLTVTLTKAQLIALLGGALTLTDVETSGDVGIVQTFLDVLDPGNPGFAIVTP